MEDWKIAVLVVMCVVFVILASVLILLIYRYWHGYPRDPCCGCWDRSDKYAAEGGSTVSGDDGPARSHPGAHPDPGVLYFLDFRQTLRAIHVCRERIESGADLQWALAREAGVTEDVHTLSLATATAATSGVGRRTRSRGAHPTRDATAEVDLDRLVARDAEFAARMEQTAARPLLLHRLIEVHRSAAPAGASAYSASPPALANPFGRAGAHANHIDVSIARDQPQIGWGTGQQPAWLVSLGQGRRPAGGGGDQRDGVGSSAAPSHLQGIFQDPPAPVPPPPATSVPAPIIFPSNTSHITASTPVFIMAAHYYICYPGTGGGVQQLQLLDDTTTRALEAAMCGEAPSRSVFMVGGPYRGSTFVVDPRTGTASFHPAATEGYGGGGDGALTVVRRSADVIRYCVDSNDGSQWRSFDRPIFLPPGQWCLRAKASSSDDKFTKTAAKVFAVSVLAHR